MSELSTLYWTSASRTHTGAVRKANEDACMEMAEQGLWVVADGMGGHASGATASKMVIDVLKDVDTAAPLSNSLDAVRSRLSDATGRLRQTALQQRDAVVARTVVVFLARDRHCVCLWAGDSRAYLYREGQLKRLTRDHTQVEELVAQGIMDREQAQSSVSSNIITRAIGANNPLELDAELLEAQDGDLYLLCSDGLTNEVSDEEIGNALAGGHCDYASMALLELALRRGARDNVTLIVMRADDAEHPTKTVFNHPPATT